jgi:hypothetical protein
MELQLRFHYLLLELTTILDDLFFAKLELEAGQMPDFPIVFDSFDPMKTVGKYE